MIIGLTGTLGAGKGTLVEFLKRRGFEHYPVRKFLIEEIEKRGLGVNRDSMVEVANDLREKNSPSFIVEQLYNQAKSKGGNAIIESIRATGEVDFLREVGRKDFYLIAVDVNPEIRYDRVIGRKSETDRISFEEFIEQEKREMFSTDLGKQNLSACMEKADYIFVSNYENLKVSERDFVEGKKGFVNLFGEFSGKKRRRPSFGENFMMEAYIWGHRSTCLRREVGAVLTKGTRFVSQGYNGASRGAPHCEELGGCLREQLDIPSGMRDEICRAIHGEINSILNATTRDERKGAVLRVTTYPCTGCARIISNSGVKEVIYWSSYNAPESEKILKDAKIKVSQYSGVSPRSYHRFWGKD